MSDLISRQAAISAINERWSRTENFDGWGADISEECEEVLNALPSADRLTGEWVEQESDHIEKIYLCSNCKNYEAWGETEKTPYCPNCGARMEIGDDYENR